MPLLSIRAASKLSPMVSVTENLEENATRVIHRSLGFFVTQLVEHLPEGGLRISHSRWHRKGLPPIELARDGSTLQVAPAANPWLKLWEPRKLAWWIAILFAIGSAFFAMGSFAASWPQYCPAMLAHGSIVNTIFFVGSLFFTTAAGLQLEEAINGDVADIGTSTRAHRPRWRWFAWKPQNAGYSAGFIQFAGTLLFNINTADAMLSQLTWLQEDVLIWTPDVIGSICFLVSSYLALVEVSHRGWSYLPRQLSWWIVMVNLLGSIAFMVAAAFNYFVPNGGNAEWSWGANFFTLLGAMCFLVASYLMIPELAGAGRAIDVPSGSIAAKAA
jgi:hypothetical protein